ncbi:MAG: hypothetical protein WBZ36_28115 [Candidatus Nitrosopolaris sp.]
MKYCNSNQIMSFHEFELDGSHGKNFKSEPSDPFLLIKSNLLISTIPSQPVGAESILNLLRTRGNEVGPGKKVAPIPQQDPVSDTMHVCSLDHMCLRH